jgi:DNA repair protein RecO (recombination protein O)
MLITTVGKSKFAKTAAIVLKQIPLGEADRLVTLFTASDGKIRAIARGVRRPRSHMAGHLEPLVYCQVMVTHGRTMDTISGVETLQSFVDLRRDLEGTTLALVCLEQVDALTPEGQSNYPILVLLLETLKLLEGGEKDKLISYFNLRLLQHLGYMPELYQCVSCLSPIQPTHNTFTPALGGVICLACDRERTSPYSVEGSDRYTIPLSLNALKVLRFMHDNPYTLVQGLRIKSMLALELESLLRGYTSYIVERQLKTPSLLHKLRRIPTQPTSQIRP